MPEIMKKNEFMEMIRSGWRELDSILGNFTRQQMESPGSCEGWAVKDVISHIAWYETEMVNVLKQHALKGSELWNLPQQERNAAIYLATRNESLQPVIEKEAHAYKTMLDLLGSMDESALNDPAAFSGMPTGWQPWSVIASNTYEHYQDHIKQLKDCLKK
ncbi:MAG: hypothetical protein A2X25_04720 [Chloroflexi bacterium GWB2_49_20]|nr:MAG: hypothetical protein A2X25_04720 [Chloroflexi bacterium GWB2_49_20]OGN80491.1 MAG: hypothetical protein A2X26_11830 [Chloroflexi bacterium GWC2_49_37]OGN83326.1 MAG: hypothetical protein A2X27_12005 [Chloroflexi bacterium GWD2_49_16]HCC78186.1 hypothetical protein [Anaerolineae bacterium]